MTRKTKTRYFGLDLSLSPGICVVEVVDRKPKLVYADSIATDSKDSDAERVAVVQSFVSTAVYTYKPFDAVVREDFTSGRNRRATQTIFAAWSAADRALHTFGYRVEETKPLLAPTRVKSLVTGNGKADKKEVAEAVSRILGLGEDYKWRAGYDDSDAVAVVLSYLIQKGLIDVA